MTSFNAIFAVLTAITTFTGMYTYKNGNKNKAYMIYALAVVLLLVGAPGNI